MNSTISAAKARARLLKTHLENSGKAISLSEALEAISASENKTDWNRYQAALKHARNTPDSPQIATRHQPHKIFAAPPGSGSGAIAEITFVKNIHDGKVPVLIMLSEHKFPTNAEQDTSDWLTIDVTYTDELITNVRDIPNYDKIKGLIIRLRLEQFPRRGLVHEIMAKSEIGSEENARLTALMFVMRDMRKWPAELKRKIGTLIFYGMELIALKEHRVYSKFLPGLIDSMRQDGGSPSLFIVTSSDIPKKDIVRSEYEYKLIISDSIHRRLFNECPVDKLYIEQGFDAVKPILDKLFTNPDRLIEDICLYVGSLSTKLILDDELNKREPLVFVQRYLKGIMGAELIQQMKQNISF